MIMIFRHYQRVKEVFRFAFRIYPRAHAIIVVGLNPRSAGVSDGRIHFARNCLAADSIVWDLYKDQVYDRNLRRANAKRVKVLQKQTISAMQHLARGPATGAEIARSGNFPGGLLAVAQALAALAADGLVECAEDTGGLWRLTTTGKAARHIIEQGVRS